MSDARAPIQPIDPNSARLYAIVARRERRAVIFRRGPSKQVRLLTWNLETDVLEAGQWFRGRVYERRCDLTPDGQGLVYFAATFRPPFYSWTAISRPPFLTAIALWPKGDSWGGGGLFDATGQLQLNHGPGSIKVADGFALPSGLRVLPLGPHSGKGEDEPIAGLRAARDGWAWDPRSNVSENEGRSARFSWVFDPPLLSHKSVDRGSGARVSLKKYLHAIHERVGRWYVETAELSDQNGRVLFTLGRVDWTDFDHNGDLLYAKDGCLFRLALTASRSDENLLAPSLVVDLNNMQFEPIVAPEWARRWP